MTIPVDLGKVTPVREVVGEDQADTDLLRQMARRAEAYLKTFSWCPAIVEQYLGYGVGGIIAVFLFRLASKAGDTDDWLWVVEGDAPSAYLVADNAPDATSALSVYCDLMESWAHAVLNDSPLRDVFPVAAPVTPEVANMLLSRMSFVREEIIPKSQSRQ